jgi:aldose 1-epimerase
MFFPSGRQLTLTKGATRVVVAQVGATLRLFEVAGRSIIWGFGENEMCSGGRGQVLAPWPNRLEDGRYEFAGIKCVAALDDHGRQCAIHGLVRWIPWEIQELSVTSVRLGCMLAPQPGYPFSLNLEVTYTLDDEGLTVQFAAYNGSSNLVPFGIGFHPYLAAGAGGIDAAHLQIPASRRLLLNARGLPYGSESVAGSPYDLRSGSGSRSNRQNPPNQTLQELHLSDCFTDLSFDDDGKWRVFFEPDDLPGNPVVVWADDSFGYIMCFTGDTFEGDLQRCAVAIEPMTCPPNALRTGESLLLLKPGERVTGSWGIEFPGKERRR